MTDMVHEHRIPCNIEQSTPIAPPLAVFRGEARQPLHVARQRILQPLDLQNHPPSHVWRQPLKIPYRFSFIQYPVAHRQPILSSEVWGSGGGDLSLANVLTKLSELRQACSADEGIHDMNPPLFSFCAIMPTDLAILRPYHHATLWTDVISAIHNEGVDQTHPEPTSPKHAKNSPDAASPEQT